MNPVDFQKLFRQLPENFMLMTPDAVIVDNTDAHEAASLKKREEVLGRSMFEAYPSVDQNQGDVIFQSQEHVRRHREPNTMPVIRYDLEVPAERGGGFEQMYWQATHFPILDERGELQYILQKTENITDKYLAEQRSRQMQQALAENQHRTEFILQSLPALIWTAQPDGHRDFFNQRWLTFTGKTQAELTGMQWLADVHPDDRDRAEKAWRESLATGQTYQVEYRLHRADGQYRWVLVRGVPRRNADEQITMWVGCAFDIHDSKQMVQELLEAKEQQSELSDQAYGAYELAKSQRESFYELFMQAPALIVILRGEDYRFEFVNPRYQELYPGRELLGRRVADAIPEAVDQGFITLLDSVYQTGQPFFGQEMPVQFPQPDGRIKNAYFDFTFQALKENGRIVGISAFAFDVTELVLTRQRLEQLPNTNSDPNAS